MDYSESGREESEQKGRMEELLLGKKKKMTREQFERLEMLS